MEGYGHGVATAAEDREEDEEATFIVRGTSLTVRLPRDAITADSSPVLQAMITGWQEIGKTDSNGSSAAQDPQFIRATSSSAPPPADAEARAATAAGDTAGRYGRGERDAEGRYVLDGPKNPHAFAALFEAVRQGGYRAPPLPGSASPGKRRAASPAASPSASSPKSAGAAAGRPASSWTRQPPPLLPELEAMLDACHYADYYLMPWQVKMQLTKELLASFKRSGPLPSEILDVAKLGLCRSDMVLDRIHLEGLNIKGLQLENSHARRLEIRDCTLADCELAMCVTANEVHISGSKLQAVRLGMFASKITVEDSSQLNGCNLRVVEELVVQDCSLQDCTFRGSDEDRKDRQIICATFRSCDIHGEVTMPFDRCACEETSFHGGEMKMTKAGASISFIRARVHLLPTALGDAKMNLCLEDCDITKALCFRRLRLTLRGVHFVKPCEMQEVEFTDKLCDISFPRSSCFKQVRFRQGLQACTATGCSFEGCNMGYGKDAVSDCLLTRCTFLACRFPFLEADSPVANFSGSNFVGCQIQWSGQFPHEESFVVNSCWLRKWNLAGCTVNDGSPS
eukprot:TRINITY_DN35629_c0_g1_i1.p1 TRINITY_DN35629_c0_g1~~TRINITY_DN35629_c0_g1_i1.p1  ORF type:complete len:591 (-),score=110.69 TRINITY_DN35629_c0_g1_i1:30-1736(-)